MTLWINKVGDFANVLKSILGTGIFGVPYIFSIAGPLPSLMITGLLGLITYKCCTALVQCKYVLIRNVGKTTEEDGNLDEETFKLKKWLTAHISYEDLGFLILGKYGRWIIKFCLTIAQFCLSINYMIVAGNAFYSLFWSVQSKIYHFPTRNSTQDEYDAFYQDTDATSLLVFVLLPFPIYAVLTMIRHIRGLGFISVISLCGLFASAITILVFACKAVGMDHSPSYFNVALLNIPIAISQITSAYECAGVIIDIESSMRGNYSSFKPNLASSLTIFFLLLSLLGCVSYTAFGNLTEQLVLNNLPTGSDVSIAVGVMLLVSSVLCYPLQVFPAVETVEKMVFPTVETQSQGEDSWLTCSQGKPINVPPELKISALSKSVPFWKRALLRFFTVSLLMTIAALMRDSFVFVLSFAGAVANIPLSFIIPSLFHFVLLRQELSTPALVLDVVLIVGGVLSSILTLISLGLTNAV